MKKDTQWKLIFFTVILILTQFSLHPSVAGDNKVVYYAYGGCYSCVRGYIEEIEFVLSPLGFTDFDLVRGEEVIEKSTELYDKMNVPSDMQGRYLLSIDDRFLFINEVPPAIVADFMENHSHIHPSIVIYNTQEGSFIPYDVEIYKILYWDGHVVTCEAKYSLSECGENFTPKVSSFSVLPVILFSGLLDGINPCAFAVLFFFITFLYVARERSSDKTKRGILTTGLIYIIAVYISYLLIGVAIIEAITLTPFPHLFNLVGSILVILLGINNLKDYFWPGRGWSLKIPRSKWKTIAKWVHKATIPSAFIVGLLVSVVEFPCTGGIYLAILGMLANTTTFNLGLTYLLAYNLMFVLPLILILGFSTNKTIVEKMRGWTLTREREMRLVTGLVMISIGVYLIATGFA